MRFSFVLSHSGWLPSLGWLVAAIPSLADHRPPEFCGKRGSVVAVVWRWCGNVVSVLWRRSRAGLITRSSAVRVVVCGSVVAVLWRGLVGWLTPYPALPHDNRTP